MYLERRTLKKWLQAYMIWKNTSRWNALKKTFKMKKGASIKIFFAQWKQEDGSVTKAKFYLPISPPRTTFQLSRWMTWKYWNTARHAGSHCIKWWTGFSINMQLFRLILRATVILKILPGRVKVIYAHWSRWPALTSFCSTPFEWVNKTFKPMNHKMIN